VGSLAIGIGLIAGGIFLESGNLSSTGSLGLRFPGVVILLGIAVLVKTYCSSGIEFRDGGILIWSVTFWCSRRQRYIEKSEIKECVLRESDGRYFAATVLNRGNTVLISKAFTLFKEAQAYLESFAARYGVPIGLQLRDEKAVERAAAFSKAETWTASIKSPLFQHVIVLSGKDETPQGEIHVTSKDAKITGAPGEIDSAWTAKGGIWGRSKVAVTQDGGVEARPVVLKSDAFGERISLSWADKSDAPWSAILTSNSGLRSNYTIKFYRGLVADDEAEPDVPVAVMVGTTSGFTLEVADLNVAPWLRLAIAAIWIQYPPADR
jgi:hypothetical protein